MSILPTVRLEPSRDPYHQEVGSIRIATRELQIYSCTKGQEERQCLLQMAFGIRHPRLGKRSAESSKSDGR